MPDPTQPKQPPTEPGTQSTEKESIRKSQEEFIGDEAQPSQNKSDYERAQKEKGNMKETDPANDI